MRLVEIVRKSIAACLLVGITAGTAAPAVAQDVELPTLRTGTHGVWAGWVAKDRSAYGAEIRRPNGTSIYFTTEYGSMSMLIVDPSANVQSAFLIASQLSVGLKQFTVYAELRGGNVIHLPVVRLEVFKAMAEEGFATLRIESHGIFQIIDLTGFGAAVGSALKAFREQG